MKRRLLFAVSVVVVVVALCRLLAYAAPNLCAISGTVYKGDGTGDANDVIWLVPNPSTQIVSGVSVTAQAVSTTTDANGVITPVSLIQGLTVSVTELNGASGPITGCVPVATTATFASVVGCTNATTTGGGGGTVTSVTGSPPITSTGGTAPVIGLTPQHLNDLLTATGNYSLGGFGLTNVGSLTGGSSLMSLAGGAGGVSIKGTTTTGLDNLSSINVNGIDNVIDWGADPTFTNDSWPALMSAVADACTNNRAVILPPGKYKVLTPFAPVCSTHPLRIYSDVGVPPNFPASIPGAVIQEAFSNDRGPTVILDHFQGISNLNGGNILSAPAVGSVGKSLSFTNAGAQVPWWIDVSDVLPSSGKYLNNLAAFDARGWVNIASLTNPNLIMESAGGVDQNANNTYEACNINVGYEGDGLSNGCQGAFGLHVGTDGKVFGRLYLTTSGLVHINSGATLFATNGWHFVELSYDGANARLIIDGILRGNVAATGTVIQRIDETMQIGREKFQFIHLPGGGGPEALNGQLYSPEISSVARSTCGGSTTLGTTCYSNPTTANPGDANSLFLLNADLTELPVNNGTALPLLEPDRASGVLLNTVAGGGPTAWVHVHNDILGCCSEPISLNNLSINGGSHSIDSSAEQVALDSIIATPTSFGAAGANVGIETSNNGSFLSRFNVITVLNGIMPAALNGGISEGNNFSLTCQGACLETGGGRWSNLFLQVAAQANWGIIHAGTSSDTFLFLDEDSENGANPFVPFVDTFGSTINIIDPTLITAGWGQSLFRSEAGGSGTLNVIGGHLNVLGGSTNPLNIIDAKSTNQGSGNVHRYRFLGVDFGDANGNIPDGTQMIGNDLTGINLLGLVEVDSLTEAVAGASHNQSYNVLPGLHVMGPTVGGLKETGAVTTTALATPTAPTVTVKGTAGVTSYTYFCVAHDATSTSVPTGATIPSAGTTITTGNATLSTTNFNSIQCGPQAGVYSWDILKTNTSTSLALAVLGFQAVFSDTGQATAGYTAPTRNSTADVKVAGVEQVVAGLFAACPACAAGTEGTHCSVTDDLAACAFGATVTGSGTHHVDAYCDGTQYVMTECK